MPNLISVIVPVYNVAGYLPQCLNSIVNQTYEQLEIILVDDGSTDESGRICDEWAAKDKRIQVIHKNNEGVSKARNTGICACTGQLIGFVDGDDCLEKNMFAEMADRLDKNDADAVMCGFYDYPYGIDKPIEKGILFIDDGTFEETILGIIRRNGYFTSVWNKLFRREVIFWEEKPILMNSAYSYGEDEVWLYEVLQGCRKISFLPKVLYHWMPRQESMIRQTKLSEGKMTIIEAKKKALELLPASRIVQRVAKGRVFDTLCGMMAVAYITDDQVKCNKLSGFISPFRFDYIRSTEVRNIRKIKMCLLFFFMKVKMPKSVIRKIYELR